MTEIENQPRPITLDQLKQKGERYQETGEIDSDILDVVGVIPATDQLAALEYGFDQVIELQFTTSDQGLQFTYQPYAGQNKEDIPVVPEDVNQAVRPVIDMGIGHFRSTFGIAEDTPLTGHFFVSKDTIHASKTQGDIDLAHTDGDLAHPENEVHYTGSFGAAATKVWRGTFVAPPGTSYEEMYDKLENQANNDNIPLIELEEGLLLMVDSHYVHASPEFDLAQDPAQVGKDRYLLNFYIKMPEAMLQEVA